MKAGKYTTYAAIRRNFKNVKEISEIINRGPTYILARLQDGQFTARERRLLLRALNEDPDDQDAVLFYFGGARQ